ncbi:BnaC01g28540D [Brassica napus]|uniref:BnaC01g28540D protein n=1 Tax=Brassica napus TaxID=3708 RepID=A0A078H9F7_BRANA|nr:BnaC01g28540D [Brassica napus]
MGGSKKLVVSKTSSSRTTESALGFLLL